MKHVLISVGRQFGSGGKCVAEAIGESLGILVYDNELIVKAAEQSGFSASLFEKNDEKKSALNLGSIFGANRYGGYTKNVLNEGELFKIQSDVIRDIAQKGDAIFVGRVSDYVLRDMDCLDVFVCAPLDSRIARITERMGVTPEEARSMIAKKDKERENYYNFFSFSHWGVASNYDLCVDSSILGVEGTAEFIIDFARRAGKVD